MLQQTNNEISFPKSHNVEDKDTKCCVHGAEHEDTASHRFTPSTLRQTFSSREDAHESTTRRREKLLRAGESGKLAQHHQSSTRASLHVTILVPSAWRLGREC